MIESSRTSDDHVQQKKNEAGGKFEFETQLVRVDSIQLKINSIDRFNSIPVQSACLCRWKWSPIQFIWN